MRTVPTKPPSLLIIPPLFYRSAHSKPMPTRTTSFAFPDISYSHAIANNYELQAWTATADKVQELSAHA